MQSIAGVCSRVSPMPILLFLISAVATTLASIAFQIGLATGHFKSYEWAMWPLFIASGALWMIWLILAVRHYLGEKKKRELPPPPPVPLPPPAVNVHFENIGNPVHDQSNRQTIAASQPAQEPRPSPMLEVIDDKNILIAYNNE